jgi:hypothetical protein
MGSPVHVAPACAGFGKESGHFRSYVRSISLHFGKRLFPELEPHGHNATALPLRQGQNCNMSLNLHAV